LQPDLQFLYSLNRLGIKVGLDHTNALLKLNGDPQKNFSSIHVAGTNGKGSTCAMINSILLNMNLKVGIYTSPHLLRFNERIRVNNKEISDNYICSFISFNKKNIEKIQSTFFETTTAMAFAYFRDQKVDVAIIETGVGGRLDSTNVLNPIVSVLTSISMDHTKILGNSLKKIAKEKCGIIKKNVPVVSAIQKKEVSLLIKNTVQKLKSTLFEVEQPQNIILSSNGTKFFYCNNEYETPLTGTHQAMNGSVAIKTCKTYLNSIKLKDIKAGLKKTFWQGRLQKIYKNPNIYYDVAHNIDGIISTVETLESIYKKKPVGLMVMKIDKDINLISKVLSKNFKLLIISGSKELGLATGDQLSEQLINNGFVNFSLLNDLDSAIDDLIKISKHREIPGLIFGSHYISKTVFNRFGILS
tara:strand:+ start:1801 stop:3042 length:1242 start_codon:yes stop_codon:yes gene_type:complete